MKIGDTRLSRTIDFFSTILGIAFKPTSSIKYYCFSFTYHGCFTFVFVFCLCLNILFITDVNETTHALYMSLTCLAYAIKIANYYYYHRGIYKCLIAVKEFDLKTKEEVEIHDRRNGVLTWIAFFYYTIPTACGASAYYKPFLNTDVVELPFRAWYPFDWRNIEKYYWTAWGYQVFGMVLIILTNVTIDLTPSYLLNMVAIQTEILGLRLSNLGKQMSINEIDFNWRDSKQKQTLQDFIGCVKLHQNILS